MSLVDKTDLELDGEVFALSERLYAISAEKRRRALIGNAQPPTAAVPSGHFVKLFSAYPKHVGAFCVVVTVYVGSLLMKVFGSLLMKVFQ